MGGPKTKNQQLSDGFVNNNYGTAISSLNSWTQRMNSDHFKTEENRLKREKEFARQHSFSDYREKFIYR